MIRLAARGAVNDPPPGRSRFGQTIAIAVYVFCVVATLSVSGTYHSLERTCHARAVMKQLDYYAIWLLIAGTFTAVHGIMCRGFWRRDLLVMVWLYAAVGIVLQVIWFRIFSGVPGLLLYLGFGWLGVASIIKLGRQIGYRTVRPLWYAGIFYTVGAVLEAVRQPVLITHWVGPHETFHLAVIAGVLIHWLFIRTLLLKHAPAIVAASVAAPRLPVPAPAAVATSAVPAL